MKIIKSYFSLLDEEMGDKIDGEKILKKIELCGRNCYKSESKIIDGSAKDFVAMLIKRGHESILEHVYISVRVICDRGVTHEIVRHRLVAYAQESTRYCNYSSENLKNLNEEIIEDVLNYLLPLSDVFIKEGEGIIFIEPFFFKNNKRQLLYRLWRFTMKVCEFTYNGLIKLGATPQEARSVLPNSLKTEIIITCNLREWRHIFRLRTDKPAHPQMQEIMTPLLNRFKELIPVVFDDIIPNDLKF